MSLRTCSPRQRRRDAAELLSLPARRRGTAAGPSATATAVSSACHRRDRAGGAGRSPRSARPGPAAAERPSLALPGAPPRARVWRRAGLATGRAVTCRARGGGAAFPPLQRPSPPHSPSSTAATVLSRRQFFLRKPGQLHPFLPAFAIAGGDGPGALHAVQSRAEPSRSACRRACAPRCCALTAEKRRRCTSPGNERAPPSARPSACPPRCPHRGAFSSSLPPAPRSRPAG